MKLFLLFAIASTAFGGGDAFSITALSNRPDKISGGDVLVRIDLPAGVSIQDVSVQLNGADIRDTFGPTGQANAYAGLIAGLRIGNNALIAFREGESAPSASLTITNHAITGPVFSGPHEQPFICQTAAFELPDGKMLGPALDENCSANTVISYVYRSTAPDDKGRARFKPLLSFTERPADLALTTTSTGETVPYIVRVETGVINRAIYQIVILHDPAHQPEPGPFSSPAAWNRRLIYSFGGGCTGGWFKQGVTTGLPFRADGAPSLVDAIAGRGYALATATLNVFGNNCQDVTAAETMMMVKERFIEAYGVPLFTFGRGGSGGAYQQIQIADNYPGLLDGIIPSATFPDVLATIQFLTDAQLLKAYYEQSLNNLTDDQKRAIAGTGALLDITRTAGGAGRISPTVFCPPELPQPLRYNALTNPSGARCDVFDHTINVYGRDPSTGFARRPIDNTGVQYGLAALNRGVITVAQFLDLNEQIGGYDNDGNIVSSRSAADTAALKAAYTTGRVTNGGGGLAHVPIIDLRGYVDAGSGDLHLKYHSFSFRERLRRANGSAANETILVHGPGLGRRMEEFTIAKMDEWLTVLTQMRFRTVDSIARARPADLQDSCYTLAGDRIAEAQTFTGGECNKLYPAFPSPRMVAGGPATNDVLKCRLKPVDFDDYQISFTVEEKERLRSIFPAGVCDWTKPGIEQRELTGTWLSY